MLCLAAIAAESYANKCQMTAELQPSESAMLTSMSCHSDADDTEVTHARY